MEEVVLDQALFDGEFIQEFNEAEYKLKAVSIEICTITYIQSKHGLNVLYIYIGDSYYLTFEGQIKAAHEKDLISSV